MGFNITNRHEKEARIAESKDKVEIARIENTTKVKISENKTNLIRDIANNVSDTVCIVLGKK